MKEARLKELKTKIENGEAPFIASCSYCSDKEVYTMGDLQDLGFTRKKYEYDNEGEVETVDWFYLGPSPITVATYNGTKLVQPNHWVSGGNHWDHLDYLGFDDYIDLVTGV